MNFRGVGFFGVFFLVTSVSFSSALGTDSYVAIASRCQPEKPDEAHLTANDFRWGYSLPEMLSKMGEIYQTEGKRLPRRLYWDQKKGHYAFPYALSRGGPVRVPLFFIEGVVQTIQSALQAGWVEGVMFPDMGHSHLLIPHALYKKWLGKFQVSELSRQYEAMLSHPEVLFLYHTAEQLRFLDEHQQVLPDPYLQNRWKTRNLIASHKPGVPIQLGQNLKSPANTVGQWPGFDWWGAGFNLSMHQQGCLYFEHKGQKVYFDLSLYDLESVVTDSYF